MYGRPQDYTRVGLLAGAFYDARGEVTPHWRELRAWTEAAHRDRDKHDVEKQMFPPCNVEWSQVGAETLATILASNPIISHLLTAFRCLFCIMS